MPRRIIDIHAHPNWHGYTADKMVRNMDAQGIDKCWMLSWDISRDDLGFTNAIVGHDPRTPGMPLWLVMEAVNAYPDRFIPCWGPDPRMRDTRARLKAAVELHGIKAYGELKLRMRYDNPYALATWRYCGELGLPVLFHLQYWPGVLERMCSGFGEWPSWYGGDMGVVENMCELCPGTTFIAHGPQAWREISGDADASDVTRPEGPVTSGGRLLDLLRRYDNLHADLSAGSGLNALRRDPAHAGKFLVEFQDKLLFGRDSLSRDLLDFVEQAGLADDVLDKILSENAIALIGE